MKKRRPWIWIGIVALIPVCIFAGPAIYRWASNSGSWGSDFTSNLMATFIGAAIGVPVGLWVDRRSAKERERADQAERQAREQRVLRLLHEEISRNHGTLLKVAGKITSEPENGLRAARVSHLLVQLQGCAWDALSASGELAYIRDSVLLAAMARCQDLIRITCSIDDRLVYILDHRIDLYKDAPRGEQVGNAVFEELTELKNLRAFWVTHGKEFLDATLELITTAQRGADKPHDDEAMRKLFGEVWAAWSKDL